MSCLLKLCCDPSPGRGLVTGGKKAIASPRSVMNSRRRKRILSDRLSGGATVDK
jgi:hypothetical protein